MTSAPRRNWALVRIGLEDRDIVSIYVEPSEAKKRHQAWANPALQKRAAALFLDGTINDRVDEPVESYGFRISKIVWMRVKWPEKTQMEMEFEDEVAATKDLEEALAGTIEDA